MVSKTSRARLVFYLEVQAFMLYFYVGEKAEIKREIAEAPISQGTNFRSIPSDESFTKGLGWMEKSETVEN